MRAIEDRRRFLQNLGSAAFLATLGSTAFDLGLVSKVSAEDGNERLDFGDLEPIVAWMQETPVDRLQPSLVKKLQEGMPLKTLIAGAALANARTFGGEDYIGFHTFMALSPALAMARLMPAGSEALPILKVLYRNTSRIHEFGGRSAEVLHSVSSSAGSIASSPSALRELVYHKSTLQAEQLLASHMAQDSQGGLEALLPTIHDHVEVHRTVLPFRAWEMREIVGEEHALTLLRQSLRYCIRAAAQPPSQEASVQSRLIAQLFDQYRLEDISVGTRRADDARVEQLSQSIDKSSPEDAATAVAEAIAAGMDPRDIGEAISLSASLLVLRDGGRLPQWEDRLKLAGSVHGDSVGVHASDAANAWRQLAMVSQRRNQFACLIVGAWQVARDRLASPNLLSDPLPVPIQGQRIDGADAASLLAQLDEAIQNRLQGQATAVVAKYCQQLLPVNELFARLVRYAVSEDGALHAEKYFHTVWTDYHATRPSLQCRHLIALARVTASEYGRPAAGQEEARALLKITG